jgi:hypothetical protein
MRLGAARAGRQRSAAASAHLRLSQAMMQTAPSTRPQQLLQATWPCCSLAAAAATCGGRAGRGVGVLVAAAAASG